jgi:hypothetical protein
MIGPDEIAAIEKRAAAARVLMGELCELASIHHASWSRAKRRGRARVSFVRRLEEQLDRIEAQAAQGDA